MRAVTFEMTAANARIYADEAALINVFRRLKRSLPTGYRDIYIKVEWFGHFGKFIRTTTNERAIVAFLSYATNLVATDTKGRGNIFVHDRQTGETERVSIPSQGP